MFKLRRMGIDTQSEHVVFIHADAVGQGILGFKPMDRILVTSQAPGSGSGSGSSQSTSITGILNFCEGSLLQLDEIGLSNSAHADLGLPDGSPVRAALAGSPMSVDKIRAKLQGKRFERSDFDEILTDVTARRYSKPELSMFVLACALEHLDDGEIADFTQAMIGSGSALHFDSPIVADKHCIGGVPGNRTTMIVVPILVSLGMTVPKTSSKAITSAAGTADTMGVLACVDLLKKDLHRVVNEVGGCIAWGGAVELAPADDILITVERPMQLDTEAQMVASILAKKKTAGATHALIDIPVGPSTKIRSQSAAEHLTRLFGHVAQVIDLQLDIVTTDARGPIGFGIGPRLEALDVLSVLHCEAQAPTDLKEKSLFLAGRILERTGTVADSCGYKAAREALESGRAGQTFAAMVRAQGEREIPDPARFTSIVEAQAEGRIRQIDCWEINRIAKLAGSPAHVAAGLRCLCSAGDAVSLAQPLLEIHAQSQEQLEMATDYAQGRLARIIQFGY